MVSGASVPASTDGHPDGLRVTAAFAVPPLTMVAETAPPAAQVADPAAPCTFTSPERSGENETERVFGALGSMVTPLEPPTAKVRVAIGCPEAAVTWTTILVMPANGALSARRVKIR